MNSFLVYYSGECFSNGDSAEEAERKVYDKISCVGEALDINATAVHPDESNLAKENYIVSFEGEIVIEAESKLNAENQGYAQLSHIGEVTIEAFKKEEHN